MTDATATEHRHRIVVGVDGSEESFAALSWGIDEAHKLGATLNAVYGWTPSWDVGPEPDNKEAWDDAYEHIEEKIREWIDENPSLPDNTTDLITFTSVHGTGQSALLTLGSDATEIIVGRRNLNSILRWFLGSTSASLAQTAKVPVTVVKQPPETAKHTNAEGGADSPRSGDSMEDPMITGETIERIEPSMVTGTDGKLPIIAGIDGSSDSVRALRFAVAAAQRTGRKLHVLFCWQLRDLGVIPGYENAIAPLRTAQAYATSILQRSLAEVTVPDDVEVSMNAYHIAAFKGLKSASEHAHWLIIGSRGLSGIDAKVLGSVSSRLVENSHCTVTVVH
ncbi:MAG: universal stress protein [Bifidobacteriaceae bacterium]|nr:universal stress protein [Bifidobacteriaceae bacterium]MCI1978823.1 universal stress protein [Bifidobacteriaceae bacterium]